MPRTVRIPLKSGVLPQPRQVVPRLKTSYELAEEAKAPTGFSDPGMAPRGTNPNPPPRLPKTASEKIAASAKAPRAPRAPASREAEFRQHMADVRRSYFESSLKAYEAQEQRHKEARERRKARSDEEVASRLTEVTDSLATTLTTPTIDRSLRGEFVVKRTPEEYEELRLKREHNRKLTDKRVLEQEYERLLVLYQQAGNFIVTEDQLEAKISALFKPVKTVPTAGLNDTQTPSWWKYFRADAASSQVVQARQRAREDELVDAALGTVKVRDGTEVRYAPGLKRTLDE